MTRPTSGTAIDVEGTISATISWNTLSDRRIVMPAQHAHYTRQVAQLWQRDRANSAI